jgi:hypothetical protein
MPYVRVNQIKCDSCNQSHDLAIQIPAYPHSNYSFECPSSKAKMLLTGISAAARVTSAAIPEGCIEAKEVE